MVTITRLSDGTYSLDFGKPGPFLVLSARKTCDLINALAEMQKTDRVLGARAGSGR